MVADLRHANQFLKVYALSSTILSIFCLAVVFLSIEREPTVIALGPSGQVLETEGALKPEVEIESALRRYIEFRYTWEPKTIRESLNRANDFVHPSTVKIFDADLMEVQKFALEKNVSQRGYASSISIDLQKQIAKVRGDRVTTIQGLTAAGPLALTLQFESGPRTKANPWGIYVVREKNE